MPGRGPQGVERGWAVGVAADPPTPILVLDLVVLAPLVEAGLTFDPVTVLPELDPAFPYQSHAASLGWRGRNRTSVTGAKTRCLDHSATRHHMGEVEAAEGVEPSAC